ncbi:MAG: hypothetical protein IKR16_06210 [Firmicutes bacterium]|nr:hypothetical protein [Bacillota bacterium]
MTGIKIALAQICPVPGDESANAEKINAYMKEAADGGAELVVFPECSLTGYAPERAAELALSIGTGPDGAAELALSIGDGPDGAPGIGGGPISAIEEAAEKLGIAVSFSFMEKSGDKFYISQELYCGGERTVYRKTHPGSREALYFAAGNEFPVSLSPVCCGMQLCWESHIPEISAEYRKQGAQLLLFPYASGMSGERCKENWQVHLPARASDNGCFAAACNLLTKDVKTGVHQTGAAGSGNAEDLRGGGLAVWDPKGRLIAQYFGTEETLITAEIGGELPRERFLKEKQGIAEHDMHTLSYFDLKRKELF